MNGQRLKDRRVAAGIAGALLSRRAGIDRARLCHIERGYISATDAEVKRIETALNELIVARQQVAAVAKEVGWPL